MPPSFFMLIFFFQSKKDEKPKAEINLDDINVVFVPDKIGNLNGMQITYFYRGSTRNLFVYTDDPKVTGFMFVKGHIACY